MIRKLELKDYELVKPLVYQVHTLHLENRPDIYIDGNPLPLEYFQSIVKDENSICYVYEENNNIIGLLTATKKSNNAIPIAKKRTTYFIEDIVVDNNHRRKGIGKKLYSFLKEKALSENVNAIELNVWAFNKSALKFYESLGMSVKNMKLENILTSDEISISEEKIKITNKVL